MSALTLTGSPFNPDNDGGAGVAWRGATFGLTKTEITSSPSSGIGVVESYFGTKTNILAALAALPYGASASSTHNGPVWYLEVAFNYSSEYANGAPDDGTLSSIWELVANDQTRDIRELPKYAALGADILSQIDHALAGDGDYATKTYSEKQIALTAYIGGGGSPNLQPTLSLFYLLAKKTISYPDSQFVLRNRRLLGSQATFRVAFANVGKVLTTSQLQSAETIPTNLLFEIENIPDPDSFDTDLYVYGWLKKTPQVRQISRGFFEASTEWYLETWSKDIFAVAT